MGGMKGKDGKKVWKKERQKKKERKKGRKIGTREIQWVVLGEKPAIE